MNTAVFSIIKHHPRLEPFCGVNQNRKVPRHVAEWLSNPRSGESLRAFVENAWFSVLDHRQKMSDNSCSVFINPPEGVEELHAPEIVFPLHEFPDIPFGSVLMNCLLPHLNNLAEAEPVFLKYQAMVLAFSQRLEAFPTVCIIGHKTGEPAHELDLMGMRFFFSPKPGRLNARICKILNASHALVTLRGGETIAERIEIANEKIRLSTEMQRLKCSEDGTALPLLNDVRMDFFPAIVIFNHKSHPNP